MENCTYIHTLAREKEAKIINETYSNQKVFVQINIDNDDNKSGINTEEVEPFFNMFEKLVNTAMQQQSTLTDLFSRKVRFIIECSYAS